MNSTQGLVPVKAREASAARDTAQGPLGTAAASAEGTYVIATLLPSMTMCFRSVLPGSFFSSSL